MAEFTAKVRFTDVRIITIEADTIEEAQAKYDTGDWDDETTIDFHADKELEPLRPVEPTVGR